MGGDLRRCGCHLLLHADGDHVGAPQQCGDRRGELRERASGCESVRHGFTVDGARDVPADREDARTDSGRDGAGEDL